MSRMPKAISDLEAWLFSASFITSIPVRRFGSYRQILLMLVAGCLFSASNAQISVRGNIVDLNGKKIEYATVAVSKEGMMVNSVISNSSGFFIITLATEGKYTFYCSQAGYQMDTALHQITKDTSIVFRLGVQSKKMQGVTVTSKQPSILRKADRYILNIENSYLSNGYSALEILERAPGLWVSNDGAIKYRGNISIAVMINGVLQRMSAEELQQYLKTLRSEQIIKIEVITSPGAEYDAEGSGGLVNILLKSARTKGLQGNLSATYRQQGRKPYLAPTALLSYKARRLTLSASYSYLQDAKLYKATNNAIYPDNFFYNTSTTIDEDRGRHLLISSLVYEIEKNHQLSVQNTFSSGIVNMLFTTGISHNFTNSPTTGLAIVERERPSSRNATTLNYTFKTDTLGSSFSLLADYTYNRSADNLDFRSRYSNATEDSVYRNRAPYTTEIFSVQGDYKQVLKNKLELKTGLKYSNISRDNNLLSENLIRNTWFKDSNTTNTFLYKENIIALYSSLSKTISRTSFAIGARGEWTRSDGHSLTTGEQYKNQYFNIFPSFNIQSVLSEKKQNSIYFSFNSRINRPDFNDVNPYRLKIDNFTYQSGNPFLKPQYSYNLDAGVNLRNRYNAGVYFNLTNRTFANLLTPKAGNIIEYQMRNFDRSLEAGFYTSLPLKIKKWWSVRNDLAIYHLSYKLQKFKNSNTVFLVRTVHNFTFSSIYSADIVADYRSPQVYSNAKAANRFNTDLGFSAKLLKGQGRIRLLFTDVFNTVRDKTRTQFNNTQIDFYQKRPTRTVGVTLSYNFYKGLKFNVKNMPQAGSEEKNRLDK